MIWSEADPRIPALMKEALAIAEAAARADEVPVGALVVQSIPVGAEAPGYKIIGRGANRRETDQSPIAHAEILAIEAAARTLGTWRLIDCLLLVTLEPCPMCLAACQQARIGQVIYGVKDPKGGALSLGYPLHQDARTHHRFEVTHCETPECGRVLSEFFKNKRR